MLKKSSAQSLLYEEELRVAPVIFPFVATPNVMVTKRGVTDRGGCQR
jgi:hypothetical protein